MSNRSKQWQREAKRRAASGGPRGAFGDGPLTRIFFALLGVGGLGTAVVTWANTRGLRQLDVASKYYALLKDDIEVHHHAPGEELLCAKYVDISSKLGVSLDDLPALRDRLPATKEPQGAERSAPPAAATTSVEPRQNALVAVEPRASERTIAAAVSPANSESHVSSTGSSSANSNAPDPTSATDAPTDAGPRSVAPVTEVGELQHTTVKLPFGDAGPVMPTKPDAPAPDDAIDEWIDYDDVQHGMRIHPLDGESPTEFANRRRHLGEILRDGSPPRSDGANGSGATPPDDRTTPGIGVGG